MRLLPNPSEVPSGQETGDPSERMLCFFLWFSPWRQASQAPGAACIALWGVRRELWP
jgi:hypothetical protein